MDRDTDLIPSSPTNSSPSSSDLDTESTGSFFPDRSTSLGTLMGVSFPHDFPVGPARLPSRQDLVPIPRAAERRRRRTRRVWWRLCRDDVAGPTSLGEFLQVERRVSGREINGDFLYGGGAAEHEAVGGGPLFEDGRVMPPAEAAASLERRRRGQGRAAEGMMGRWPVLLAGICSGGEG
ncbi:uncharacterized protein At3g17950-like [Typha angustifolia]|uniref:uncharacterized protein At3g17950-like n=1 Tax=Typha angustifolia TaxID=59011 RepID=UPI003C2AB436